MIMGYLVSTPADLSACPRCDMPILIGLDEGLQARVDLVPLPNLAAEIAAIATGRWTYTRLRDGSLAHRDQSRLADPLLAAPVHAEHACPPASARRPA
jgi:hypothetical protein